VRSEILFTKNSKAEVFRVKWL